MKIADTIPNSLFFNPAAPRFEVRHDAARSGRRTRARRLGLAMETSISHKQEIICNAVLMLCLLAAVTVCVFQFFAV